MQFILAVHPRVTIDQEKKILDDSILLINISEISVIDINEENKTALISLKDGNCYELSPRHTQSLLESLNSNLSDSRLVLNRDMSQVYELLKQ